MLEQEIADFDPTLPDIFTQRNLVPVKILYKKEKWGSIVVQAQSVDGSSEFVVKRCREGAEKKTLRQLAREGEFYRQFGHHAAVPDMIDAGDNLLITQYIDGISLNKWINSYLHNVRGDNVTDEFKDLLTELFIQAEDLFLGSQKWVSDNIKQRAEKIASDLTGLFFRLCRSGPLEKTGSTLAYSSSTTLALIARISVKRCIRNRLQQAKELPEGLSYGDFHLNNILVSEGGHVRFIDFGDVSLSGCFLVDLLYLAAILGGQLQNFPNHRACFDRTLSQRLLSKTGSCQELFADILPVMELAVSINPRFQFTAMKTSILKAQLTFIPRLLSIVCRQSK